MNPNNMVSMDSHAVATLQYIRASMERAGSVALPGSAGFAMGSIGCVVAALSLLPSLRNYWLPLWLAAAVPAACLGAALVARQGTLRRLVLAGTPLHKFALCLAPGLFAGLVTTAVLWSAELMQPIRGLWLLAYGCALISASAVTTRMLTWMGCGFACCGFAALLASDAQQNVLMGAGFGGLHILFAVLIGRENRRVCQG